MKLPLGFSSIFLVLLHSLFLSLVVLFSLVSPSSSFSSSPSLISHSFSSSFISPFVLSSSPFFLLSFSVVADLVSPTFADGDQRNGDGAPSVPCWSAPCKITAIEGEELSPDAPPLAPQPEAHPVKLTCRSGGTGIARLQDLCIHQMPSFTKILEISNTSISRLEASSFSNLVHLKKLDLRHNKIGTIQPQAFRGLSSLKRLDLSHNNVSSLNGSQLDGLPDLVRLKVGRNPLTTIDEGVKESLPSLRAIEIGDTLLRCDCRLSWLLRETQDNRKSSSGEGEEPPSHVGSRKKSRPLRLLGGATCRGPKSVRGTKLRKLSPTQLTCEKWKMTSPSALELEPEVDQVVFAGDSLKLRCRVTGLGASSAKVWWRREGREGKGPEEVFPEEERGQTPPDGLTVKTSSWREKMESYVHIPELSWDHSGQWSCVVEGGGRNNSRSLSIYVIHRNTKYCPVNVTANNKGAYSWPRTVSSVSVNLPCQGLSSASHPSVGSASWSSLSPSEPSGEGREARHFCAADGSWGYLDTSECPFISEATRILQHFATTNLSATGSSLSESARTLRNFTARADVFEDPVDVAFLAQTVRQYVELLSQAIHAHPAAEVLIDVIASAVASSKEVLTSSEDLQGSCRSLVSSLWKLVDDIPTLTRAATPHLHLYQVGVRLHSFAGVSCVWFRKSLHSVERHFRCNTNNYSVLYAVEEDVTDARIRIPSNLFANLSLPSSSSAMEENRSSSERDEAALRLQFFVYDSAKLFPTRKSSSWQITSPVIGARLNDALEISSSEGIYVTLRSAIYSHNIAPAVWEPGPNGTRGDWAKGKCQIVRVHNSMVVFKCHQLAHFGLLQDMAAFDGGHGNKGAKFRPSPPGVYVGSVVCCVFLMTSIATWGIHHQRIRTMSKNKHSFINTWVALLFLVTLFTVGIYQTEAPKVCQSIGVLLHYLTTCVLLWIIVSVTNLYKKVTKVLRPPLPTDEPPPDVPLPPKPMLRFYLVGWGIALIVCGISAAVNLRFYGTFSYCFLAWNPSIAAFYAPSAALVFILIAFFLLTQCVLNANHAGYSEATGNTETTELELLDATSPASENPPPSGRADDELSIASQTSSLSLTDAQHSPTTQLRAHAVTLILFLLTWASGAITAAAPFASVIPFHSIIFSVMYAVCASSLGIFIFVFFCVTRSDVIEAWKDLPAFCVAPIREDEARLTVANNVVRTSSAGASNLAPPTTTNNQLLLPTSTSPMVAPSVHSIDSSNTHQTNKSSSLSHSVHASNKVESLSKTSNALHLLNLSSLSESVNYAPEMFYNPKQAGVAKRFFQKQRLKQMMKQNNLDMNRTDSDCNSSTVYRPRKTTHNIHSESDISGFNHSYLEVSNKINNTNIHVDSLYTGKNKHTTKALTPELLCVLGPPRDTCSIVSSVENDQHQWPMTFKHQCVSNPAFQQLKNLNIPRSSLSLGDASRSKEDFAHRVSPLVFQETLPCALPTSSPEGKGPSKRTGGRAHRSQRGIRVRRKQPWRLRGGSSRDDDLEWSEEEVAAAPLAFGNATDDVPSSIVVDCVDGETLRLTSGLVKSGGSVSSLTFSPTSSPPSPLVPSLPLSTFNSPASLTPTVPPVGDFPTSPRGEMEWMHLLNKHRPSLERELELEREGEPGANRDSFCTSFSDGDSVEGVVDEEPWPSPLLRRREFVAGIRTRDGDGENDSMDGDSMEECSSAATSMAPGADPSPPPSLPVSISPFDSPHRKFPPHNTPDSLSLDSGSLLSQFPSMDNPPLSHIDSPTHADPHTPTASTPVNPPVSPSTPLETAKSEDSRGGISPLGTSVSLNQYVVPPTHMTGRHPSEGTESTDTPYNEGSLAERPQKDDPASWRRRHAWNELPRKGEESGRYMIGASDGVADEGYRDETLERGSSSSRETDV